VLILLGACFGACFGDVRRRAGRQRLLRGDEQCASQGNAINEGGECEFGEGGLGTCKDKKCIQADTKHPCSKTALEISSGIDKAKIKELLAVIAEKPRHNGWSNDNKIAIREILLQKFIDLGLEDSAKIGFTPKPGKQARPEGFHIYGLLKGTAVNKIWVVVAHYDTVNEVDGAIDNGSGVAAMLEIIRVLAAWKAGIKITNLRNPSPFSPQITKRSVVLPMAPQNCSMANFPSTKLISKE